MGMNNNNNAANVRRLVVCAMLVAVGTLLSGPLSLYFGTFKTGIETLPKILAGVLFGPLWGGLVGALTDFLQAILFPHGGYQPLFTAVAFFFGFIPGLFFRRGQPVTFLRLLLAVACGQILASVILNTTVLVILGYAKSGWWVTASPRIINQAVMIPVYTVITHYIVQLIKKRNLLKRD